MPKSPEALVYPRDGPWVSKQLSLQARHLQTQRRKKVYNVATERLNASFGCQDRNIEHTTTEV